ncbi:MAG: efflux RND transporter periplasmic adaptor subunit [Xanthomonadaceae bacterium]|nr:efflux RND transporter periplasmic adaptor subunit [Xanthomonadaceae bacterium]
MRLSPIAFAILLAACGAGPAAQPAGDEATVVHAAGLVEPAGEERVLIPEVGGRLARVAFAEGDTVAKGQVLAEIENAEFLAAVALARAQLALREAERDRLRRGARVEERAEARAVRDEARALAKQADDDLARRRALAQRGTLGREALDQAQAQADAARARLAVADARHALVEAGAREEDLRVAEAAVAAAQAELDRAQALYEKTLIRSPVDGVVLKRDLREGETVVALSPLPLARIGDLSRRYVRADVDELDVGRVREGMRATVASDAFPGREFGAEVVHVAGRMGRRSVVTERPAERVDARVLEVLLRLDPGADLPVGMRVDVRIAVGG